MTKMVFKGVGMSVPVLSFTYRLPVQVKTVCVNDSGTKTWEAV